MRPGSDRRSDRRPLFGDRSVLKALIAPVLAVGLIVGGAPAVAMADDAASAPAVEQAAAVTEQPAAEPAPEPAPAPAPAPVVEQPGAGDAAVAPIGPASPAAAEQADAGAAGVASDQRAVSQPAESAAAALPAAAAAFDAYEVCATWRIEPGEDRWPQVLLSRECDYEPVAECEPYSVQTDLYWIRDAEDEAFWLSLERLESAADDARLEAHGYRVVVIPASGTCEEPTPNPSPSSSGSARLTLVKEVSGDGGAAPSSWTLQASQDGITWVTLPQGEPQFLALGTWFLRETGGPDGYEFVDLSCDSYTYNAAELWITLRAGDDNVCTFTNRVVPPRITLTKIVVGGNAQASEFSLTATAPGDDPIVVPQGTPREMGAGTYSLAETGGPAGYVLTDLDCGGEFVSTTATSPLLVLEPGDEVACTYTNTYQDETFDLSLVKTHGELAENGVEAGDAFTWLLEVTNNGPATAIDAVVTDTIPSGLTVTGVTVPAGWTDDSVGSAISVTIPSLASGATGTIQVQVTVDADPPAAPAAFAPPGTAPPIAPPLPGDIENTACVDADGDTNPENDCDDDTVPRKAIVANVWVSCINDAPFLMFNVQASPSLAGMPITLTWTPLTDTGVVPPNVTMTVAPGVTTRLNWPGVVYDSNGVSIDWPGWRPLQPSDLGPDGLPLPGLEVYGTSVRDTSEPDNAWRELTLVEFSVNPTFSSTAIYPQATPQCATPMQASFRLPATGGDAGDAGGLLAAAALMLFGGAVLFVRSRRRMA